MCCFVCQISSKLNHTNHLCPYFLVLGEEKYILNCNEQSVQLLKDQVSFKPTLSQHELGALLGHKMFIYSRKAYCSVTNGHGFESVLISSLRRAPEVAVC